MSAKALAGRQTKEEAEAAYIDFITRQQPHEKEIEKENQLIKKHTMALHIKQQTEIRQKSAAFAEEFYRIADENSSYTSMRKMQKLLDENITADNITAFLDAYDKAKQGDSSIIDTVTSEIMPSGERSEQKNVLRTIMAKLTDAARKAEVSEGDIKKANDDFEASIKKEYDSWSGAFRRTNPLEMEKAIDFLRGAIIAKKTDNVEEISNTDAISAFNENFASTDAEAQKLYKNAREEEGWTASFGDAVCGWFGCNTVEDMDKKLGENAASVKRLASAETEAEFKTIYQEIFGIEFDKNKIAARDAALSDYYEAQILNTTISVINDLLKSADSMNYNDLRSSIEEKFQLDDETVDAIIASYEDSLDIPADNDDAKRTLILQFLRDTHTNSSETFMELTKGKTLEQMDKDLELLNKSAFGTNDIVKDVVQFNENMVITEMVTEGAFEVAGTIALAFVPGLGQIAAARLAANTAKWGTKAVKLTQTLKKAEKTFETLDKLQKGKALTSNIANRRAQIGLKMMNAGVATATIDLSNGDEVKEVVRKTLMNMSFAGIGASSSTLAPKLMKAFGIAKPLANEIAEEIINVAGVYGVTKISGDDYGSSDAFIDFATGLVIARVSHIKSGSINTANEAAVHKPRISRGVKGDVNNHRDMIADGEVARNINQQHLNANERKMVEDALDEVPTQEELDLYHKEHGYIEPSREERQALDKHQEQVRKDYANAHEIGNNLNIKRQKFAAQVKNDIEKLDDELKGIDGNIRRLEQQIAGAKRFGKSTTALEKQLAVLTEKRNLKAAELETLKKDI